MENALTAPDGLVSILFGLAGVLFALQYLRGQSDSSAGITLILIGFACIFLTKILFLSKVFLSYEMQLFFDLFLHLTAAVCLICGGLRFKGLKIVSPWLAPVLCLGAAAWSWNVVLVMGDGKLYVFSKILANVVGFGVFGASLWGKKLHNAIGFVLTGWLCVFLAVYNLLINVSWAKSLFPSSFETFMYVAIMCGLILISNNLLGHTFHSLKKEADEHKERLRLMIQMSPFPIIISRLKDDQLMLINGKAGELLGWNVKNPHKYKMVDCFANPSNRQELLTKLEKNPVIDDFEIQAKPRKGVPFWLLLSARVIDFEREIALYMAFQDITERKQKELQLFDQATRDPLTKCYNRRQFNELAKNEVQRFERYQHPFCLFMIDADHFKNVNDTHGHAVGDLVLMSLADCLRRSLRETDIIARFGGEEFVVLLPETTLENAHHVTERLRIRFSKIVVKNETGDDVRFTVSTGVVSSDTTSNIEEMLKLSDECLYVAKENGRNRVVLYTENGPDKDIPVPTGEDIDKVQAEDLYYFVPDSTPVPLAEGAGSPLDSAVGDDMDDMPLDDDDDDDYPSDNASEGTDLSSLYSDDGEDTSYTPISANIPPPPDPVAPTQEDLSAIMGDSDDSLLYDPYALGGEEETPLPEAPVLEPEGEEEQQYEYVEAPAAEGEDDQQYEYVEAPLEPDLEEEVELPPEPALEPDLEPEYEPELPPEPAEEPELEPDLEEEVELPPEPALEPDLEPEMPPEPTFTQENDDASLSDGFTPPPASMSFTPPPAPSIAPTTGAIEPIPPALPEAPAPAALQKAPPPSNMPQMPKMKLPIKMMAVKVPQMPTALKMKMPKLPPKPPVPPQG